MKRKSSQINGDATSTPKPTSSKKQKASSNQLASVKSATTPREGPEKSFRAGLFDDEVLISYTKEYSESIPYKHAVISTLMDDDLLRSVRDEVRENVHFTPKETDIYKIHQSGDLANLDGLDNAALAKLPSLLKLRDALYSPEFRKYVATVTNSGELSGKKTDMAINVYTPGCHLLCHDDVIGSRRVSYILYLTDPDIPWKAEWGGALRLFPTTEEVDDDGSKSRTPTPDFTKVIPPAWNQLSFFAVQPGESFHDVEEVYHAPTKEQQDKEGGRVRMAISGWFHIPQIGEDGYVEGAEEKLAEKSSLVQLQGKSDRFDFPQDRLVEVPITEASKDEEEGFSPEDVEFLLQFMAPTYLTPDTVGQVAEYFGEQSSVTLDGILSKKFSAKLREYIEKEEATRLPASSGDIEKTGWKVARPPHKHRFVYQQTSQPVDATTKGKNKAPELSPVQELLDVFLPSPQFRRWLEIASECQIASYSLLARRFRKGLDYALATSHEGEARLEVCLTLTPTSGWGADDEPEADEEDAEKTKSNGKTKTSKGKSKKASEPELEIEEEEEEEDEDVGGHEVYMARDDEEVGDAAIYKSSTDAQDDPVLFTVPASWNKMSIVLRDSGVLKFVKYVSMKAKGDRWDICGVFDVKDEDDDEEGAEVDAEEAETEADSSQPSLQELLQDSSEEETFNGFPDSDESDSD